MSKTFATTPTENSPALTDDVMTARGIAVGCERKPTWQKVLDLFRTNQTRIVGLTAGATVATDASAGEIFDLTLNQNVTLSNPTGGIDGKVIRWRIKQDATGGRTVTLGNAFRIPSSATTPLAWSTAAGAMDIFSAQYNSAASKWDVVSLIPGY